MQGENSSITANILYAARRYCRASHPSLSGAVRYTNQLYFGPKRLLHPLGRRVEKEWEW